MDANTVTAIATLSVSVAALSVSLAVFLIERVRRQATPSWQPKRTRVQGAGEDNAAFENIRDLGTIYPVGEGVMEGAFFDVRHAVLREGSFPRSFSFRDGKVDYSILPLRSDVQAGREPVVAMYWWGPGLFSRKFYGMRLHTRSLRYERYGRSGWRPWKRIWKPAGIPQLEPAPITAAPAASDKAWKRYQRKFKA
ncbi:hypothetical protein [Arthrobacter sp.]|uniref:hypothetical protein n=1 Tax=Arthrobacter sp. TaxID=1667 RepID=UPI003A8F4341